MRIYTAHTRPFAAPMLVREGFAFWGLVFGPLWLLASGIWLPGVAACAIAIAVAVLAPPELATVLGWALAWLIGLFGRDLYRWQLQQRGYTEVHVVAAPDQDTALGRLLDRRPDLIADAVGIELRA